MKELFFALLAKTYNLAPERIAELLFKKADDGTQTEEINETALTQLLELDESRVKKLRDDTKSFDNGHKKGLKEAMEKLERELREEFGIESSATGVDLVKEIAAISAKVSMTDDAVKLHPTFIALEKSARENQDALRAELEGKINEIQTGYARKERFATIAEQVNTFFDTLRPVLPANPTAANTQRKYFLDVFASYDYDIQPDGSIIIKDIEGKRVETNHGHPVTLEELVKAEAEKRFDFAAQDPKSNSDPSKNSPGPNPNLANPPKTAEEARRRLFDAKTPEERQPLYDLLKQIEGE